MTYRQIHPQFTRTFYLFERLHELTQETLWNYIGYGLPPGAFMTAVMKNNFIESVCNADHSWDNESFKQLAIWLSYYAPAECYGDEEKIKKWIKKTDQERMEIMIESGFMPSMIDILKGIAVA